MDILLILLAALAIDLALGEPPSPIHPVVWMAAREPAVERPGHTRLQFAKAEEVRGVGFDLGRDRVDVFVPVMDVVGDTLRALKGGSFFGHPWIGVARSDRGVAATSLRT